MKVTRKCLHCWAEYETTMPYPKLTCSKTCATREAAWNRWIRESRLVAMGSVFAPHATSNLAMGASLFDVTELARI